MLRLGAQQNGKKHCKDVCKLIAEYPKGKGGCIVKKYDDYVFCSRCDSWMLKIIMKGNGRCPCCNFRPRYK